MPNLVTFSVNPTAMPCVQSLEELIDRCQKVLAHAWMVRTFVKHSEEIDEYPELQGIVRTVFDAARALETQAGDPASYFKMLTKKLSRLKKANQEFAEQVKTASEHTNFKQAVISMNACVEELTYLLEQSKSMLPAVASVVAAPLPSASDFTSSSLEPQA